MIHFSNNIDSYGVFLKKIVALIYGIVGGTPQYLLQMSDKLSVEENIKNTYLNPISFLYEEPVNFLKREVREPAIYTAIITAIATGHSRMSEISTKVGEDTNVCSNYLKNLINLGIIQKETPYGEKASKKSVYSKEFYYLGHMKASGKLREFVMPNTDKTAVEIEWILDVPVREDLYEYIVNE